MEVRNVLLRLPLLLILLYSPEKALAQNTHKDSIVYRITYHDTIIYRYDTIRIKHFVHTDTLWTPSPSQPLAEAPSTGKGLSNRNNWGIGPSLGAYYSPINGFDINIGFGVQYYMFAIPSFRNPHMAHSKRNKK